jgi:hypothetical protein
MLTFASCAYSYDGNKDLFICPCIFKSVPMADIPQRSFPDRNKEVVQQTEWSYLVSEKFYYEFVLLSGKKNYNLSRATFHTSSFVNNIFHPPCLC